MFEKDVEDKKKNVRHAACPWLRACVWLGMGVRVRRMCQCARSMQCSEPFALHNMLFIPQCSEPFALHVHTAPHQSFADV